ncbi:acetyl-CoA carboxylase biotin carboxyl carrier protein subunit, partial [Rhizorhabdus histidinilytica]
VAGHSHLVALDDGAAGGKLRAVGGETLLFLDGEAWPIEAPRADHAGGGGAVSDGALLAPMPGKVIAVEVAEGDAVTKGQKLLVLEAMKMEQAMLAPFDGIVAELKASVGGQVSEGAMLVRVEKAEG